MAKRVKESAKPLTPTTTVQQDMVVAGQRTINLIWETTQSKIALLVVVVGLAINAIVIVAFMVFNREVTVNQLALISVCLQFINLTTGIVIGFYFSRTNHSAIGGIGAKATEDQSYVGR